MKTLTLPPPAISEPALSVAAVTVITYIPVGISLDRTRFYASKASAPNVLAESTDDGATWTDVKTITGGQNTIIAVMETDDGELLVATAQNGNASPGTLLKSTGWATSHTTATFTAKLSSIGGYFDGRWSLHAFTMGNDALVPDSSRFGVLCEYGPQTSVTYASGNSDTTDLTKGRRVYFTTDTWATSSVIFDIASYFPNANGLHCHSVAFDSYWRRIWLTIGDTQTNTVGAGNLLILVSDLDSNGVPGPWQTLPAVTSGDGAQSTTIVVFPDCVVFGSDNRPGIMRIPRVGYRQTGTAQYPVIMAVGTGAQMIANNGHRNRKQVGAPMLMSFQGVGAALWPVIYYSADGLVYTELYRDQPTPGGGTRNLYGPSLTGAIVFIASSPPGDRYFRATIEEPGRGFLSRHLDITGDGATTVFTVPHRLGATPRQAYAFDQRANAGTYTVTFDANNIILTFAAAPANAALLAFELRYA